jgi:large subunit ribosomal protein LP0
LLAVSVASDYTFAGSEQIKEYLENPEAFAVAAPVAAAGADTGAAQEAAPAEEEESEDDVSGKREGHDDADRSDANYL